jgi:hypothetical protein
MHPHALPTDRIARSVSRVTVTMLGRTFHATALTHISPWRVAVLPVPGAKPFAVALSSDRSGCAALASAMLGIAEDELDLEMIDDVLRELANMTAGQLKHDLANDQALGLPKVQDGECLLVAGAGWAHHVLACDAIQLFVSLTSSTP